MARTRWYLNEDLGVYPWSGTRSDRAAQFPGDVATRWGHLGYLTEEAAEEAADEWADYLDGVITRCEFEFGPHSDHEDCERILADMNGDY